MRIGWALLLSAFLAACPASALWSQAIAPGANPFARPAGESESTFDPATRPTPPSVPGATPAPRPIAPAASPAVPQPIGAAPPAGNSAPPAATGGAAPANPLAGQPIYTRIYRFNIPFTLSPSREPNEAPVEVQLHVSGDQGKNWTLYGRQHPSQPNFEFRAGGDGEFWFMSRTIDRSGRMRPATGFRPELRVVVDTRPPRLELTATLGPSGEIVVDWEAEDESLQGETLKLEYQANLRDPWQPVAVELPRGGDPRTKLSGHTVWVPHAASEAVNVRAEVRDRAGNPTVVHRQVKMQAGATADAPPGPLPTQPPVASAAPTPTPPPPGAVPWPTDQVAARPLAGTNGQSPTGQPVTPAWPNPAPAAAPVHPPVASRAGERAALADAPPPALPAAETPRDARGLPLGEKPRMTTARRFNLHYDVEAVGPQGVAKVELWTTRDGGQTWENWGVDPDRASPYPVEVDREGTFGFRIVVYGNNGLSSAVPQAGDTADVWVTVDSSKPVAKITSAPYGTGENVGALEIHWEAADSNQNLGERPVTLKFSELPGGPWTIIAAGLPNNGQYNWRVDARTPQLIYLRLEVRDEAGNIGLHELAEPINTRGLLPKGKIREFQPIGDETQGASRIRALR